MHSLRSRTVLTLTHRGARQPGTVSRRLAPPCSTSTMQPPPPVPPAAAVATQQQQQQQQGVHHHQQQENDDDASIARLLTDCHCHPQLDPAHMQAVLGLKASTLAAMSVSHDVDWGIMQQLHQLAGAKVLPGFGIHPWWAHLHASACGDTWQQLLEAPSDEQLQQAVAILHRGDPVTNSGSYATNRPHKPSESSSTGGDGSGGAAFSGVRARQDHHQQDQQQQQQQQQECLGLGLRVVSLQEWQGRLRQLLTDNPRAFVGEIGVDRAATIPGSKAKTSLAHQLELLKTQVSLAGEFQRPVSVHCVRGSGHLLAFFTHLASSTPLSACPPSIMLHSYGGSVEEIPRFCGLKGLGPRFFFSFSAAINQRTPDKLRARIAAVPDDRLLIESDQVTPLVIDAGLMSIARIVADVKGWSLREATDRLAANFRAFYAGQLVPPQ